MELVFGVPGDPPSLGERLRLREDGCEVCALDGGRTGRLMGLLGPRWSLEKKSRAQTPSICRERWG